VRGPTELRDAARRGLAAAIEAGRRCSDWLTLQAAALVDRERWDAGRTLADRAQAVSWPRAAVLSGLLTVGAATIWFAFQPHGLRAHPPRLPHEREWKASQAAARAFEAGPSPALMAANQSVTGDSAQ